MWERKSIFRKSLNNLLWRSNSNNKDGGSIQSRSMLLLTTGGVLVNSHNLKHCFQQEVAVSKAVDRSKLNRRTLPPISASVASQSRCCGGIDAFVFVSIFVFSLVFPCIWNTAVISITMSGTLHQPILFARHHSVV